VTDAERRRAREVVGGDVVSSTVAFGRRVPADNAWRERAPQQSVLEQELAQVRGPVLQIFYVLCRIHVWSAQRCWCFGGDSGGTISIRLS
jgi:hypothetical protein